MPPYLRSWFLLSVLVVGCSSAPPPEPASPISPAVDEAIAAEARDNPAAPRRPVPEGHLRREDVMGVLSEGVPSLLQKVEVEPSLDREGHFRGWRVISIRDPLLAAGDIQKGDVVRKVNGQPVENPYQFFDVFQSLAFAPELHLAIERGTEARDLRYPINDDPAAPPIPRPAMQGPPPGAPQGPAGAAQGSGATQGSGAAQSPGGAPSEQPAPAPKKKRRKK